MSELRPEDLLELALRLDPERDPEREAQRQELRRSSVHGAAFRELEDWAAACRAACAAADRRDAAARADDGFVARILARTTREDLGWRGDVGLLRTFLGARWRASVALRLAAASLLLHVLALPVLAFLVLRDDPRPRAFATGIEYPGDVLPLAPEHAAEPERALEYPTGFGAGELDLSAASDRILVENARRRARLALDAVEGPRPTVAGDAPLPAGVEGLLEARARLWAGGAVAPPLPRRPEGAADALERALALDLRVDLWLAGVGEAPVLAGPLVADADTPAERLLAAAQARALACGIAADGGLAPAETAETLSAAWARDLRDALRGHDGPAAERWRRWADARASR